MRSVTQAEFYAAVGPLDCHPRPVRCILPDGRVDYGSDFETPDRRLVGRTRPTGEYTDGTQVNTYLLPEN